jgi:hypothetical protein
MLPSLLQIHTKGELLIKHCPMELIKEYNLPHNLAPLVLLNGTAEWYCNILQHCGDNRNTLACPLSISWSMIQPPRTVPEDDVDALCMNVLTGTQGMECDTSKQYGMADGFIKKEFKHKNEKEWERPLSILFNAFIFMQVRVEQCTACVPYVGGRESCGASCLC